MKEAAAAPPPLSPLHCTAEYYVVCCGSADGNTRVTQSLAGSLKAPNRIPNCGRSESEREEGDTGETPSERVSARANLDLFRLLQLWGCLLLLYN